LADAKGESIVSVVERFIRGPDSGGAVRPGEVVTAPSFGQFDLEVDVGFVAQGGAAALRLSPSRSWSTPHGIPSISAARLITSETVYVDGGYHIID
jgi:hypothetical protein